MQNLDRWARELHATAEAERGGSHIIRTAALNLSRALNGYNKLLRKCYGMPLADGVVRRPAPDETGGDGGA